VPVVTANEYRAKAKEVFDKSKQEHNPAMKAQLELIALAYLDMAEQVERKTAADRSERASHS
jgi:hypothetical protein